MVKAFVTAAIAVMVLSASANAETREHRAGQPGYTPGGGVTVSTGQRSGGRYGGGRYGGYSGSSKVVKVQPAPNVPQQKNWGIYPNARNVRDHRGCLGPGVGPCAGRRTKVSARRRRSAQGNPATTPARRGFPDPCFSEASCNTRGAVKENALRQPRVPKATGGLT